MELALSAPQMGTDQHRACHLVLLVMLSGCLPCGRTGAVEGSLPPSPAAFEGTRLLLLRHTQRVDFSDPTWIGDTDSPYDPCITEEGHKQAARIGFKLAHTGIARVLCSPFLCAAQTAQGVAHYLEDVFAIQIETGLCEMLHPTWFPEAQLQVPGSEETLWGPSDLLKEMCTYLDDSHETLCTPVFPESIAQFRQRCRTLVAQLVKMHRGESLLLVTHASVIEEMIKALIPGATVPDLPEGSLTTLVCSTASGEGGVAVVDSACDRTEEAQVRSRKSRASFRRRRGGGLDRQMPKAHDDAVGKRGRSVSTDALIGADKFSGACESVGARRLGWRLERMADTRLRNESEPLLEHVWEPYPNDI